MHSFPAQRFHPARAPRQWVRLLVCAALCGLIAACGFKLKGVSPLPFNTLYTNISENSIFGSQIRRAIVASSPNTRFVSDVRDAQARLIQISNNQTLREVSIDAQGRVEEYELNLDLIFQLTDSKGRILLPPTTLTATREIPYDDNVVQAKQGEIATLFKEMQHSLVDQMVRRLTSPEVAEAFRHADELPDADAETAPPAPPAESRTPTPWNRTHIEPGAGTR